MAEDIQYHSTAFDAINLIDAHYQKFSFQRHYHLDFHIGLITGGRQVFKHNGNSHCVGAGQLVIMPPDDIHDGRSWRESGYDVKVITISPTWLSHLADIDTPDTLITFRQLIVEDPSIFNQLSTLFHTLKQTNSSQLAIDCAPYEGFSQLFEQYGSVVTAKNARLGQKHISKLKDYLMENLDQAIRLQDLSDLCQLSESQFQRRFKAQMGLTPYAWLSRLRLEKSMQLLKSGINGTDVALQVGFYDQAHFSKAFKSNFGITPSQVRCQPYT
ncbi:AraC family transcriptional regulator [Vibrio sp. S4M6]|uniref:AraC family transcriptional regulator n=1 Tax=Vibrio sinus TaxID=2946865 RepID=UPI00202A722E|nr:AraC family transcriptional regulator [Vibrio sinus]MCL9782923.1 AraC family transcriptional regulator [Vibrio sinus]